MNKVNALREDTIATITEAIAAGTMTPVAGAEKLRGHGYTSVGARDAILDILDAAGLTYCEDCDGVGVAAPPGMVGARKCPHCKSQGSIKT